CMQPLELPWTF
nr:immunoglobulin light chain junction region [Macaca mulatta]MOW51727.1 immunoglobulin light chain junction region [Macaca mulatta]